MGCFPYVPRNGLLTPEYRNSLKQIYFFIEHFEYSSLLHFCITCVFHSVSTLGTVSTFLSIEATQWSCDICMMIPHSSSKATAERRVHKASKWDSWGVDTVSLNDNTTCIQPCLPWAPAVFTTFESQMFPLLPLFPSFSGPSHMRFFPACLLGKL